jgi:Zn-dependent protease with chaperone function
MSPSFLAAIRFPGSATFVVESCMDSLYPAGPANVPATLTQPSSIYRRHAWIAALSLVVFAALYLAMTAWLGWTAYRLLGQVFEGNSSNALSAIIIGVGAAFLALFMAKALFFIKRGASSGDIEITAQEQPRLFAFLNRLADEAGAPRPHRVYVSPRVNASVFYDLSIANFLLPSRKNLEIGLGLVNVLTLSEFKAVLAHEFGHFAQRTMAVGRWVYIAQQIASHLIERRDAFDNLLLGLSRFDLRVAWVGWVLRIVVWSIRSMVELFFRVVVLAQRALSREMEYQADLVSASLTGSDALVHALHKLHAADVAWDRALDFAGREMHAERALDDLFAVQHRFIERMRAVLADPHFGVAPEVPTSDPANHRVFRQEMAQPPRMWSTHPANSDREANVKRHYLAAPMDTRSAWELFDDPGAVRAKVSASVFEGERPPSAPLEECLQRVDQEFERHMLDRRYRGSFLERSVVRNASTLQDLYTTIPPGTDLGAAIRELYGDAHDRDLDQLRELEKERATLRGLAAGHLSAPGGLVRWRGRDLRRREIPAAITALEAEIAPVQQAIEQHDQRCRSLHLAAAGKLGGGWAEYLKGLAALLHYADHTLADVHDAKGVLSNTYRVVTADGKVSASEASRLINSCNVLGKVLGEVYTASREVSVGDEVGDALGERNWSEWFGEFKLPPTTRENLGEWLNAVDGWINSATGRLGSLASCSLDALLHNEDRVARALMEGGILPAAPPAPTVPASYASLLPGTERKRVDRLTAWDRFQLADGWLAGGARLVIAAAVVGGVLFLGTSTGHALLSIRNGLGRAVSVEIDGTSHQLRSGANLEIPLDLSNAHAVVTRTLDGEIIESFDASTEHMGHAVYNVAGATPLTMWTASYGHAREQPNRELGAPRWSDTAVDHVLSEPPKSINTKSGSGTRSVLSALSNADPRYAASLLKNAEQRDGMLRAHALWDDANSADVMEWLYAAAELPDIREILAQRLARSPNEVLSLRSLEDFSKGEEHDQVCADQRTAAAKSPDSADMAYLAIRCIADTDEKNAAFLAAQKQWPKNPWLGYAASYALERQGQWKDASDMLRASMAQLSPIVNVATLDLVRQLRAIDALPGKDEARLAAHSRYARLSFESESGAGYADTAAENGFRMLAKGRLDEALQHVRKYPDVADRLRVLVAASVGASADQIAAAFHSEGMRALNDTAAWSAAALAMREHVDPAPFIEAASAQTDKEDAQAIVRFLQAVRASKSAEAAESALGQVPARTRGLAYAGAAILMQKKCPATWRSQAQKLLFAFERPYLGPIEHGG